MTAVPPTLARVIVDSVAGMVVDGVAGDRVVAAVQVDAVGLFEAVTGQVSIHDVTGKRGMVVPNVEEDAVADIAEDSRVAHRQTGTVCRTGTIQAVNARR